MFATIQSPHIRFLSKNLNIGIKKPPGGGQRKKQ
jgi:hypothetical protein